MPNYYGLGPPFFGGQQNVLSRQEGERLIKNDVRGLLLTLPGERIYRPEFGTLLRAFTFEQIEAGGLEELRSHVREQIQRFEERVRVNRVDIVAYPDERAITVSVDLSPNDQPLVNYLVEVKLSSSGGNNG